MEFGGGVTGFSHFGGQTGQLESVPHNVVHVNIGGAMGDPATAALDPIFWLHHANIDRLWEVWLTQQQRNNPVDARWLNFTFRFHNANAQPVQLGVRDVERINQLNYAYTPAFPQAATTPVPMPIVTPCCSNTCYPDSSDSATASSSQYTSAVTALHRILLRARWIVVGATDAPILLSASGPVDTLLTLVPEHERNVRLTSKVGPTPLVPPPRSVLRITNVTGSGQLPPLNVFINSGSGSPEGTENFVGCIGLFGLEEASTPSVECDGSGLSFAIDVSDAIEHLRSRSMTGTKNPSAFR